MGEGMYDKRGFRGLLKLRVFAACYALRRNVAAILLGTVATIVIYHSKWYSIKTTVTPYMATLVYTPLYIFCQARLSVPRMPYVITRIAFTDKLKLTFTDLMISSSLWGVFLTIIQICLIKSIWNVYILQRLILDILYFMVVAGISHAIYIYTKQAALSSSITLILLMTDYYLSVYKHVMGVHGVIVYTTFAGESFLNSCVTLMLINLILLILRFYICYYNMDLLEWELK